MNVVDLRSALYALGARCPPGTEIVIAGGAALLLGGYIDRPTVDVDVLHAQPPLREVEPHILAVAELADLSPTWVNDAAKAWTFVLPPDFLDRLVDVGLFDRLRVRALGRPDLILMKVVGGRPADREDLQRLAPSPAEIAFVTRELPRIARARPDLALAADLYLHQFGRDP
jgi:hypothetical protein